MPPDELDKEKKKPEDSMLKGLAQLSQIGFYIAACILIGVFAGRWVDSFLGTSPWFLLIFALLGMGAAFKYLYDMGKKL